MASYEEFDDAAIPEGVEVAGEEDEISLFEDDEKTANPDDIRFGWGEMVFLTMAVVPAELLSVALKAPPEGLFTALLGLCINAGISAFLFFWLYFIHGGTGNRFVKKLIAKRALRAAVTRGLIGTVIPMFQTISLFWVFLEARSDAVKLATKIAERAYGKGYFN